ncbi:hypothetical protein [Clostridium amazonitimonense]|nr:hypothetical protein [Clostridium amazonitimonense]
MSGRTKYTAEEKYEVTIKINNTNNILLKLNDEVFTKYAIINWW